VSSAVWSAISKLVVNSRQNSTVRPVPFCDGTCQYDKLASFRTTEACRLCEILDMHTGIFLIPKSTVSRGVPKAGIKGFISPKLDLTTDAEYAANSVNVNMRL